MHRLSISIAGLAPAADAPWTVRDRVDARAAIAWVATHTRDVQLDATLAGIRPRELDRSARRDLAALLRRLDLQLSGLDLWIPPEHFTDAVHQQRAIDATTAAIELAGELCSLVGPQSNPTVSLTLPEALTLETRNVLIDAALGRGVTLADHRLGASASVPAIGLGLDPATVLLAGQDPAALAAKASAKLGSVRLSDATLVSRALPGDSGARLDVLALLATLQVIAFPHACVIDPRGLGPADQRCAPSAWKDAGLTAQA